MTVLARTDVPASLSDQMELARALAVSGLLPGHLREKPANLLAIQYAARSIDVPIWQAVQSMQVIDGKVGLSADLMRALILRAGHTFRVENSDEQSATVVVIRCDDPDRYEHRATFTIADAQLAGLAGRGAWNKYPRAMLVARATTLVARQACADVLAGMAYTPEELGADVDEDGRITVSAKPHKPAPTVTVVNPTTGEAFDAPVETSGEGVVLDASTPSSLPALEAVLQASGANVERDRALEAESAWTAPQPTPEQVSVNLWREQLATCESKSALAKLGASIPKVTEDPDLQADLKREHSHRMAEVEASKATAESGAA